jgi:hypothetical protein
MAEAGGGSKRGGATKAYRIEAAANGRGGAAYLHMLACHAADWDRLFGLQPYLNPT